jgi:hypothetical protein
VIFANSILPSRAPSEAGDGGKQILVFQVSTGTNARSIELVMGVFSVLLSLSLSLFRTRAIGTRSCGSLAML